LPSKNVHDIRFYILESRLFAVAFKQDVSKKLESRLVVVAFKKLA